MTEPQPILAGVARVDISPPEPQLLTPTGMTRREPTLGVLDPLTAGALAIDVGGEPLILLTCDLRRIWHPWVVEVRGRIAEAVGCDATRVFFSAVHNHSSSPTTWDDSAESRAALDRAERKILDGFVAAATEAWQSRRPAEIAATHLRLAEPIGLNRRIRASNGTCLTCWHAGAVCPPGQKFVGPGGPHATLVTALAAREPGAARPFALLSTYPTHPHLAPARYFSGEFPGGIRRAIESRWPETTVLCANFTGGDIDMHIAHPMAPGDEDRLVDWFTEWADRLGGRFADAVLPAIEAIDGWTDRTTLEHRYWSENEEAPPPAHIHIVNAVALGDVAVVSIPAEMFNEYGDRLHRASPFAETVIMGYNGSNNAYLVPPRVYEEGSYEVMRGYAAPGEVQLMPCGRRVLPGRDDGDLVAEKANELLRALRAGT